MELSHIGEQGQAMYQIRKEIRLEHTQVIPQKTNLEKMLKKEMVKNN